MPSVPIDSNFDLFLATDGFIVFAVVMAVILIATYLIAAADRRKVQGD
ncbi:MAG: hypothetical protein GIW99_07130 [Candidatus Eremiobacteraeota bacterium]|nr:hypothetical protein [Candidatus Eremiobacteraeota bacterium]MBC5827436.1 hypothetical protein [Candidatus Eremiobacteraeota bacterium]